METFDKYVIKPGRSNFDQTDERYFEPCSEAKAEFWMLSGSLKGRLDLIGNFHSREEAEQIYSRIVGRPFGASAIARPNRTPRR